MSCFPKQRRDGLKGPNLPTESHYPLLPEEPGELNGWTPLVSCSLLLHKLAILPDLSLIYPHFHAHHPLTTFYYPYHLFDATMPPTTSSMFSLTPNIYSISTYSTYPNSPTSYHPHLFYASHESTTSLLHIISSTVTHYIFHAHHQFPLPLSPNSQDQPFQILCPP